MLGRRGFLCACCGLAGYALVGGRLEARAAAPAAGQGDADLYRFLEDSFQAAVARSHETRTWLGLPGDHSAWDDIGEAGAAADAAFAEAQLTALRKHDPAGLSDAARLDRQLYEQRLLGQLEAHRWRLNSYPVEHFNGRHGAIVDLLSGTHPIRDARDAQAWITRVRAVPGAVDQLLAALEVRAARGVLPPRFSLQKSLDAARNVLSGRPFTAGPGDSALLAAFGRKLDALKLPPAESEALMAKAAAALSDSFAPAWTRLAAGLEGLVARATDDDGVWKLPDGADFYRYCLKDHTTLDLDPEQVHALGLSEVKRIQADMAEIQAKVGFKGSLQDFYRFLRTDDRFYYPDTDAGRAGYIRDASAILDGLKAVLDGQFGLKPKAPLEVRRFELYREASETIARYGRPAADGSRPGTYYVNLSRMREMPKYQMEVLAFHEGIPGHHMQIALAQEMSGQPTFRRFEFHTAYGEGWGLYSERLPKELGFYQDPYSDYGRLTFELWRAVRLVVDTGIHAKRWTRQQAMDYFTANLAFTPEVAEREVDRYIVYPGQACAYHIGLLEILKLRDRARGALGPRFTAASFHDAVLGSGSVPLPVLGQVVDAWVAKTKA
ncbi:DUF885 domain-containing protein [Aerophototrophica crusticola]|uniref:DUF885 domain-containing protein n=1 Tax=Aerophototrophica crusticola TaxID=1709002 RepID=A0A858R2Z3_9PROT|nr:DUF885 domain-containing protein [Rhodospirillaceae bacterium B3]